MLDVNRCDPTFELEKSNSSGQSTILNVPGGIKHLIIDAIRSMEVQHWGLAMRIARLYVVPDTNLLHNQ